MPNNTTTTSKEDRKMKFADMELTEGFKKHCDKVIRLVKSDITKKYNKVFEEWKDRVCIDRLPVDDEQKDNK